MNQFKKIFIYGVPGSGKTYFSQKLKKLLNIPLLEGDKIKDKLRRIKTRKEAPFLFLPTCKAYKEFGELNQENAIKGLLDVRNELNQAVINEIKDHSSLIIE